MEVTICSNVSISKGGKWKNMKEIRGKPVLDTLEEIADPKHTALLVIDVQNDNCSPRGIRALKGIDISNLRKILPPLKTVLEEARRLGLSVIFTRATRSRDGSHEAGPRLRFIEKAIYGLGSEFVGSEDKLEGTWGHEVVEELEPRPNERQIIKYRSSAFIGTTLDIILRNRGIKSAVVVGLASWACVLATVKDLEQHDYYPVVLSDCVNSNRRDLHDAALLLLAHIGDVVTSEQLLKVWRPATVPEA